MREPGAAEGDTTERDGGRRKSILVSAVGYTMPAIIGIASSVHAYLVLGIGNLAEPGPGLWPLIVGIALTLSSAVLAGILFNRWPREQFTRGAIKVLAGLGIAALFVTFVQVLGVLISVAALVIAWLRLVSRESWKISGIVALLSAAAFTVVFVELLSIPLPALPTFLAR